MEKILMQQMIGISTYKLSQLVDETECAASTPYGEHTYDSIVEALNELDDELDDVRMQLGMAEELADRLRKRYEQD